MGPLLDLLLASVAALLGPASVAERSAVQGPDGPYNVLFILSDQHSARALGCYGNGFGGLGGSLTPRLDRLAAEGARFDAAFCATPQCSPSRLTLLTGRWPHAHGLRWNGIWEPLGEATFPDLAREAGYATASIGKHHMMWPEQPPPYRNDLGFDRVLDEADYASHCQAAGQPTFEAPGNYQELSGLPQHLARTGFTQSPNEFHPVGYYADRVIDFLEERAEDGRPFVCWYSMNSPHTPILPTGPADPQDFAHRWQPWWSLDLPPNLDKLATTLRLADRQSLFASVTDDQWRQVLAYYYGFVSQVDWNVGRVVDALDELGLGERTLVVYTSDHGEMGSEMRCWTKGTGSYDAIARVPLIARLPGVVPEGTVVEELVAGVDIVPTLMEVTGLPMGDAERRRLDGRSALDLALGRAVADWPREVFIEFGLPLSAFGRQRAIRTHAEKYVFDEAGGGQEEYYRLDLDPWEIDDRSLDPRPFVQRRIHELRGRLDAWWDRERGHAPYYAPTPGPTSAPRPASGPQPPPGSTDVARRVDPCWVPSTAAARQEVFLGFSPASLQSWRVLGPMESSFHPGVLPAGTTIYWRVDQSNANGLTIGPVWSFTTTHGGSGGPALASSPDPPSGARGVSRGTSLAWSAAPGVRAQDLWFGPEGTLRLVASNLGPNVAHFEVGRLSAGVTYAWRVDGHDDEGSTLGEIWNFEVSATGLPGMPKAPSPAHLAQASFASGRRLSLTWTPGDGATSHEVYLGRTFPLAYRGTVREPRFDAGPLPEGGNWYWRVDERNEAGVRRGWTWRLTLAP